MEPHEITVDDDLHEAAKQVEVWFIPFFTAHLGPIW